MELIKYPTPEDILRLNDLIPDWVFSGKDFLCIDYLEGYIEELFIPFQVNSWIRMISQRMKDVDYSFIMASYYFMNGIPDEEWYQSNSSGIKYFPNFSEEDNRNKFAFEYYSDAFFYKVFSVLDAVAHLMTLVFSLTWGDKEKIGFYKAIHKIKGINPELYKDLKKIMEKREFKEINRIRNDATHNFSEGHVHSEVVQKPNGVSHTIGKYMMVKEKYLLMEWMSVTRIDILNLLSRKWNAHLKTE